MAGGAPKTPVREHRTVEVMCELSEPKDWLRFVQLDIFVEDWSDLGLSDDDLRALELLIMLTGSGSPVVPGTGGLKKLRFSSDKWNTGKSGAARVCYADFPSHGLVVLVCAYRKSEKENLSKEERSAIKAVLDRTKRYLAEGK